MNVKFNTLTLICKKSREVIDLSSHITIFYGKISSGKSTIARLIDFCLGGELEKTPAIQSELLAVTLSATFGKYSVTFERDINTSSFIRTSWLGPGQEGGSVNAPRQAGLSPVWGDNVYSFSDLLFFFLGYTPPKVRRSKFDPDSPLIRLSFRDFMEYCYLEQDKLDSSFYNLEVPILREKSKDVLKYVIGFYSDRLNELEIEFDRVRQERLGKVGAIKQINEFLSKFGFESEIEISNRITETQTQLHYALERQKELQDQYKTDTHPSDQLRERIRALGDQINRELIASSDIQEKISELEALKAELLSAKMKISRATTATEILSGVSFDKCPVCGSTVGKSHNFDHDDKSCYLCKSDLLSTDDSHLPQQAEVISTDLTSRVDDILLSLKNHYKAKNHQDQVIIQLHENKRQMDSRLTAMLRDYESVFLANAKETEREIATLQERISGLQRLQQMPGAVVALQKDVRILISEEEEIKQTLANEKKSLHEAANNIDLLETNYLNALLEVDLPGVNADDSVSIDSRTWIPQILPNGDESKAWDFYNAGSGGKKTLLKVLFAITLHKVSVEKELPLPNFIVIDTPMKNIGKEKNEELFKGFYKYLYELACGPLNKTQIIIIDSDYFPPENQEIDISERFMTPSDPNYPPLITYYQGS